MTPETDHVPYRLLGSTGRARLQQRLETAVRRWLQTWVSEGSTSASVRLVPRGKSAQPVRDAGSVLQVVRAGGRALLGVHFHGCALRQVVGIPIDRFGAGAAPPHARGFAAQLAAAMQRGLANELMDSASIADWEFDELAEGGARGDGRVVKAAAEIASVLYADRELALLHLSPVLVNALVPLGVVPAKTQLAPCRRAIGKSRVTLAAVLGDAELSVADFMSLDRGDVIVLNARLGDTCRIEVPGVAPVAEATLGKRGQQRAIRIRRTDLERR